MLPGGRWTVISVRSVSGLGAGLGLLGWFGPLVVGIWTVCVVVCWVEGVFGDLPLLLLLRG